MIPTAAADDPAELRRILQDCRTIAVVGLSAEWHRPSYFAAKYMQAKGYRIVPVNPRYPAILGETCFARLEDIPFPVDMVDVFRKPADLPPIAASAVAVGARCLWQQLGVANLEADAIARAGGLASVMDRCGGDLSLSGWPALLVFDPADGDQAGGRPRRAVQARA